MKMKSIISILFLVTIYIFLPKQVLAKEDERDATGFKDGEIGSTPEERAVIRNRIDRNINCYKLDLNTDMSVKDFIATCVNGLVSADGCAVNIESACINGREVSLAAMDVYKGNLEGNGFEPRVSKGLSESNFTDPSTMYNEFDLPNGTSSHLCNKVPGDFERALFSSNQLYEDRLPPGNYVVESIPPVLSSNSNMASMSVHWRVTVTGATKKVEVQLRNGGDIDQQISSLGRSGAFKTTDSTFLFALVKLMRRNLVRCKKVETTDLQVNEDFDKEHQQALIEAQKYLLNANLGLNGREFKSNLTSFIENMPGTPKPRMSAPK